ncbi:MAG TPA: glycoside hydrolase family 172 protein, partial [Gemmataceae bacterium]|nr:glycoside hydrolase family 172 protein [Gemmataceae bacterium]
MKRLALPAALALLLGSVVPARAAEKVTLENLLRQMTDLSLLAEYPDPPYVSKQFSSYDRASERPGNDAWFANYDRGFTLYDGTLKGRTPYYKNGPMQMRPPDGHFEAGAHVGIAPTHKPVGNYVWVYATAPDGRAIDGKIPQGYVEKSAITMDPQGHVLADMDGPGCVVRIWSADPDEAGKVRIYLDGAKEPVIEAPLQTLLSGKWKTRIDGKEVTPFPDPIACERSRGWNLYFPIAYQKHCKITVEKSDIYYHVDYRTYPQGTKIEPFSLDALASILGRIHKETLPVLSNAKARILPGGRVVGPIWARAEQALSAAADTAPGKPSEPVEFEGPRAVTLLTVQLREVKDEVKALRELVLVVKFDGASQPQIWCPVGDFFGSSPGLSLQPSIPFQFQRSRNLGGLLELQCRFWMPFAKSARFTLLNRGTEPIKAGLTVGTVAHPWTDRSMHFHAKWRTATMNTRPFRDWTYCDLKGKGVFVGDMLTVFNPSPAWWGEGDEKIYVDGEKFPSWFGTGSEDYYAYAWGDSRPYQHAYHNQTRCDGPGSRGWTSVNRFHVLDAIPFEKSFRFDMEVWHWTPNIDVTYAATSYWYARPGATDDFKEPDARVLQTLPQLPPPYRIAGALEGEKLKVLGKSAA